MIPQLSALPVFVQIAVIIGVFCLIVVGLYFGAKFGLRITGKDFSLSFGKDQPKKTGPRHSGCRNCQDAIDTFRRVREVESLIFEYKYRKLMKRQMEFVESGSKQAINKLLRIYTSMLKAKGHDNPIKTESCQSYIMVLKVLDQRIVDLCRNFMRDNHLAEGSEQDFEGYINSRTQDIRFLVTETLNDLYHYDADIKRSELYDCNDAEFPEFSRVIRESLIRCRTVAIEINQVVEVMKIEVDQLFLKFMPED